MYVCVVRVVACARVAGGVRSAISKPKQAVAAKKQQKMEQGSVARQIWRRTVAYSYEITRNPESGLVITCIYAVITLQV